MNNVIVCYIMCYINKYISYTLFFQSICKNFFFFFFFSSFFISMDCRASFVPRYKMIFSILFSSKGVAQWCVSSIFGLGKYLTLIFLFLNIIFSISPDIAESPKISVVPFLHLSLFCCRELLSALLT